LGGVNDFERRLLVAVDAAGYGSGDDQEHFALQPGLTAALEVSAATAGLRRGHRVPDVASVGPRVLEARGE
jgi:hypothetical protein